MFDIRDHGSQWTSNYGYWRYPAIFLGVTYVFSVLCTIYLQGDYYVDRERGILYVWPTNSVPYKDSDKIYVSIVPTCIE